MFDKNLNDLVRGIRNNRENEAKYIAACLEEIKQELRQHNLAVKANAVAKLTYLQMLGYDVSWAGFNIIEVMSSTKFTEKRIGYLAASQSFHQDTEVLMLATNMIRKDLSATSQYEAGLTLSSLSCFMSPDLARDLANDIMSLLTSTRPYLRKKGVLLLYKVFLRYPEALRPAFPRLKEKLEDPDPGVQSAAVNVICELARKNPKNYLSLAPTFFKLMTSSTNNWMLIKIIKLFGALTPLEPRLGKKLIEPLTNLIHSTSAMSLLYECINTVIAVLISISSGMPNHAASIQLCVQKLRILIEDSDQNLKYLGLLAMSKILKTSPKSVGSHKDLIMSCLDDADDSIRLRALDLLSGMVSKKNLMEIVKKLMSHMAKAEGTTYRDELLTKILEICSQNDYQYISNFEWYVSVLVELSQMEGGAHGGKLAHQMMDVAIRVEAIRPFAVEQMALLIENACVLLRSGRHTSAAEVLYAACWLVGEFSSLLARPRHALLSMISGLAPGLAPHIQATFVHNILKLYTRLEETDPEVDQLILLKLEELVSSPVLEVQERASSALQVVRLMARQEGGADRQDLGLLYTGELNPVGPKAQKKVPLPEGLDLDAWINPPPEESGSEEEEGEDENLGGQVFVRDDLSGGGGSSRKQPSPEITPEEAAANKAARLAQQSSNPNYLKDSARSPLRQISASVDEIAVQAIDLAVPLHIPGLASADTYFNLEPSSSEKKKKKKKKKAKQAASSSEDEGPNLAVSKQLDMPEGASLSDHEDDRPGADDPHRALADISLEDLDWPSDKKEKKKKNVTASNDDSLVVFQESMKNGGQLDITPPLVEHKQHKKKHKKNKKSATASSSSKHHPETVEADLLGLEAETVASAARVLAADENIQVCYLAGECGVVDSIYNLSLTAISLVQEKCKDVRLAGSCGELSFTRSLKPGAQKVKTLAFPVETYQDRKLVGEVLYSLGGQERSICLEADLPLAAWLTPATISGEEMAELLVSGQLAFMLARPATCSTSLQGTLDTLTNNFRLWTVEVQGNTASLYGQAGSNRARLAFLIKMADGGASVSLEGRSGDRELLAGLLEEMANQLA